jgi:pentatricopeptide repeat protein
VYSFNAAMQACATARQPEAALQLLERLEASPIDADYVSFNAILDALYGQPDRARELWKLG